MAKAAGLVRRAGFVLALAVAARAAAGTPAARPEGYGASPYVLDDSTRPATRADSLRPRLDSLRADSLGIDSVALAGADAALAMDRAAAVHLHGALPGMLSLAGLPPVRGTLELLPDALLFQPDVGGDPIVYPIYRDSYRADGSAIRRPAVQLLSIAALGQRPVFLFHLDGAVFETASPGVLVELAGNPDWLDSLATTRTGFDRLLVSPSDTAAQRAALSDLVASPYADSLFRLFGRPTRPVGLVGSTGASARRLGEYIGSRDSLSLAPARMTAEAQLRHGLAHELAHRWQRTSPRTVARLWRGVPPITDSLRYGFGNVGEHQAEAMAFAFHYAQTTADPAMLPSERLRLLEAYERLVPGTRAMARWLLSRPLYAGHPLAGSPLRSAPTAVATDGCRDAGTDARVASPVGAAPGCALQGSE